MGYSTFEEWLLAWGTKRKDLLIQLRQRGILFRKALQIQPSSSFSHFYQDALQAFHGTCSTLPDHIHVGCNSRKPLTLSAHGFPTSHSRQAFLGSQIVAKIASSCAQNHVSEESLPCHEQEIGQVDIATSLEDYKVGQVNGSSAQKSMLKRDEAQLDAVHGLKTNGRKLTSGSIHVIVGPMFAGKTTALLQRVQAEASIGRRVALVKSDKDTRYGLTFVVSHEGRRMPCWAVSSLAAFRSRIGEDEYSKLDIIGIDEAQFLTDLCSFCQTAADYEGKTLIVAGLDGDFQRNKFGSILDLIPLADSIIKLSSQCELCGMPALFTFRKEDDRNTELIGGKDTYMPVCREHYYSGQVVLKATRAVFSAHDSVSSHVVMEKGTTLLLDRELSM